MSKKTSAKTSAKTSSKTSSKTLLNSKLTNSKTKNTKNTKNKSKKTKKTKKQHSIDKYCGYYKTDINGKVNKKLYNSCKINKYCRKYKCQDIDNKMLKAKQKNIGFNYSKIIFNKLKESCNQAIVVEDDKLFTKKKRKCEDKAIRQIYKDYSMEDIFNKSKECDKIICAKEQQIFNKNLFRGKQIKLNKSQEDLIKKDNIENDVDLELIKRGDL